MSEWDFLWGLSGQELEDAMTSGMTDGDESFIEYQERKQLRKNRNEDWEKLKALRESGQISKEDFKNRKTVLFSNDID